MKNHTLYDYGILLSKEITINCFVCFQWMLLAIDAIYWICLNEQVRYTHRERNGKKCLIFGRCFIICFTNLFHLLVRDAVNFYSFSFKSFFNVHHSVFFFDGSTVNTTMIIWCHRDNWHWCISRAFILSPLRIIFFSRSFILLELQLAILVMEHFIHDYVIIFLDFSMFVLIMSLNASVTLFFFCYFGLLAFIINTTTTTAEKSIARKMQ